MKILKSHSTQVSNEDLENFNFLRKKALQYIQDLASSTWTDHNIHDPGITILEALCYALSDVGFRMNFSTPDLLCDENGNYLSKSFYKPQEILPSHAVTIADFRKILLDLPNIKNAWLTPALDKNVITTLDYEELFLVPDESKLSTRNTIENSQLPDLKKLEILNSNALFIYGLYEVTIEFESHPILGNIDSGNGFEIYLETDKFGEIYYEIGAWKYLLNDKRALLAIAESVANNSEAIDLNFKLSSYNKYNNNDSKLFQRILSQWNFDIDLLIDEKLVFTFTNVIFIPFLNKDQGISGDALLEFLKKDNFNFFKNCFSKIVALSKSFSLIESTLNGNRNLCEDFMPSLSAIPTIDFKICADIEVQSQANIDLIQATIYYIIEQYLSPSIVFYNYDQMIKKGQSNDEIFTGPLLKHGFILDEEMGVNSFQNFTINLSDIINSIYEIEGLITCKNIDLILLDESGNKIPQNSKWEIHVPTGFKPVLNKRKSKLLFYKNDLPLTANFRNSISIFKILNTNYSKRIQPNLPNLEFPSTFRNLAKHYSLANDFPATYKIGKNLPDNYLGDNQYFKSKQLEGFLLIFDQLIANFLLDINQFKEILSWRTIAHIQHNSVGTDWRRSYLTDDKDVNAIWQKALESNLDFFQKRNKTLDFLLSQFAENLEEIDNYFYLTIDNTSSTMEEYYESLVSLKENYLSDYLNISANRGAAVNVQETESYFTTSISGYEHKLSKLIGCDLSIEGRRKTTSDVDKENKNERGYFHLLEHILLRVPKLTPEVVAKIELEKISIELLSVCLEDDCNNCSTIDPYSFTASILLPSYLRIYADMYYRDYIEKLIRKETPSHILLRVCWIDEVSMKLYEEAIDLWWQAKNKLENCDSQQHTDALIQYLKAQNSLIAVIKKHRSDYFPATLHDCNDQGIENNTRVFLNKTILSNPQK